MGGAWIKSSLTGEEQYEGPINIIKRAEKFTVLKLYRGKHKLWGKILWEPRVVSHTKRGAN